MNLKEDLLSILTNKSCFLCFKTSHKMIHLLEEFEIKCEYFGLQINIAEIIKCLFPLYDISQSQSCNTCSDLLIRIYILFEKRKQVENILSNTIKNIYVKLKELLTTPLVEKSSLVLNLISNTKQNINTESNVNRNVSDCSKESKGDIVLNECLRPYDSTGSVTLQTTVIEKNPLLLNLESNKKYNLKTESSVNTVEPICENISKCNSQTIETHKRIRKKVYYNCKLCSYKTLCKAVLDGHMNKKHLNIRPFVCNTCYKGFYRKSNLVEHIQSHDDNKELCELCGDVFRQKRSLIDHLRLHSNDRPYECNICGKKFITSGRRSDHMKRSHMTKTESCMFCSKQFGLKKELTRHMKSVHNKI